MDLELPISIGDVNKEITEGLENEPESRELADFVSNSLRGAALHRLAGTVVYTNGYNRLVENVGFGDERDLWQEAWTGMVEAWKEYKEKDRRFLAYRTRTTNYWQERGEEVDANFLVVGYLKVRMRSRIGKYLYDNIGHHSGLKGKGARKTKTFSELAGSLENTEDNEDYLLGMISLNVDRVNETNSVPRNTFQNIDQFFDIDPINFQDEEAPPVRKLLFEAALDAVFKDRKAIVHGKLEDLPKETEELEKKAFQALYIDKKPLKQAYLEGYVLNPDNDHRLQELVKSRLREEGLLNNDEVLVDKIWKRGVAGKVVVLDPRLKTGYDALRGAAWRLAKRLPQRQDLVRDIFIQKLRDYKVERDQKLI